MNENEKLYLKWLEKQKANGMKSVTYSTTDGDTSSEDFFKEANAMNEAEATVADGKENFPRYNLEELFGNAIDLAVSKGRAKPLVFNDTTTKK